MDLRYPENTVWYIEARSSSHPREDGKYDTCGSGVVVWLRKKGEPGKGRRYLLTCAHVVRGKSADGAPGYGPVLDDLRVWSPGEGFAPVAASIARIAHFIKPLTLEAVVPDLRIAVDDWVILEVPDEGFRMSATAVRACVEVPEGELTIIGYPGGSASFLDHLVKPTRSHDFEFRDLHDRVVRLHGNEARPGMSGGGLFDATGALVGIHRSRTDGILECHSVSATYIEEELAAAGYEVVETRHDDASLHGTESTVDRRSSSKGQKTKWSRRALLAGVAGASVAGVGWWLTRRTPIAIGIKQWVGYAPLVVAAKMDLRKDLKITFESVEEIADARRLLLAGKIHAGMWLAATHAINRSDKTPARMVLKLDDSFYEDGIIARDSIQTVNDLVGKKVAYQKYDAGHCMLMALCRDKIDINEIQLKHVTAKDVPLFLANNSDFVAATTYEPHLDEAVRDIPGMKLFGRAVNFEMREFGIVDALAVHEDFLDQHQDAVGSLIEGWYQAVALLSTSPPNPDALRIACEFMGSEGMKGDNPVVYENPMPANQLMEMISSGHVELAGRKENMKFFARDQNDVSVFRRQYEYFGNAWGSDLQAGSWDFTEADGSQPFLPHR